MTDEQLTEIALAHGFGPAMLALGSSAVAGKPERFLPMLRAIEQLSRHAALEEAARVCDAIEVDRWNLYKGRPPYNGTEDGRANSYVEGESDGAGKCAVALRALADGDTI